MYRMSLLVCCFVFYRSLIDINKSAESVFFSDQRTKHDFSAKHITMVTIMKARETMRYDIAIM